jgi:hypothetical protein
MRKLVHLGGSGDDVYRYEAVSNPQGVLNLGEQVSFASHRCGWAYATDALLPEHNEHGVLFDGYLDKTFNPYWNQKYNQELPRQVPWTGFAHNPPTAPQWFPGNILLTSLFRPPVARASLENCVGLLTLTEYLAEYLRSELGVPASALIFPTEIPEAIFNFESFLANQQKQIVAVGWWLRRTMSIRYLPLDKQSPYRKIRLQNSQNLINTTIRAASRLEFVHDWRSRRLEERYRDNTQDVTYLPNDAYDRMLQENIVFLDLYDASANNAVVECIARATPLLVNRIPPVVEYLGADYPFYFDSLEEAAAKALDFDLVQRTHEYLLTCPTRARLSPTAFLAEFRASEVYQHLKSACARRCAA